MKKDTVKLIEQLVFIDERIAINTERHKAFETVLRLTNLNSDAKESLEESSKIFKENIEALQKEKQRLEK